MIWKKILMSIVIVGGVTCMILSFMDIDAKYNKYILGVLSGLTVIVPAVIWYSDGKDNERRDNTLAKHEDSLTWHDAEISKKANSDQGFYDI